MQFYSRRRSSCGKTGTTSQCPNRGPSWRVLGQVLYLSSGFTVPSFLFLSKAEILYLHIRLIFSLHKKHFILVYLFTEKIMAWSLFIFHLFEVHLRSPFTGLFHSNKSSSPLAKVLFAVGNHDHAWMLGNICACISKSKEMLDITTTWEYICTHSSTTVGNQ